MMYLMQKLLCCSGTSHMFPISCWLIIHNRVFHFLGEKIKDTIPPYSQRVSFPKLKQKNLTHTGCFSEDLTLLKHPVIGFIFNVA